MLGFDCRGLPCGIGNRALTRRMYFKMSPVDLPVSIPVNHAPALA